MLGIVYFLIFGFFKFDRQEDSLVELAAKHLYVQHGSSSSPAQVKEAVHEIISASQLEAKTEAKWVQVVGAAHSQVSVLGRSQGRGAEVEGKWRMGKRGRNRKRRISDILSHLHQSSFVANRQQVDLVQAEVVDYGREKWPMFFSRFFKVSAVSGQHSKGKQHSTVLKLGTCFLDSL